MDKVQLLERHFNAFINEEDTRNFFIGMTDYLEFADSIPEFDAITADILVPKKMLEDKLQTLEKAALDKVLIAYKEISSYITKNKITDAGIISELNDTKGWVEDKTSGSYSKPEGIQVSLGDVISILYKMPEHQAFAAKYVELYRGNPELVKNYLPIQEIKEYTEVKEEIKRKSETELWGQLAEIAWRYQTIKYGRETHKSLVKDYTENY